MRGITTRRAARLFGAAMALSLSVMSWASAAPVSVSVVSPAEGSTISRSAEPEMAVDAVASFEEPAPGSRSFYVARDACGGSVAPNVRLTTRINTKYTSSCSSLANVGNEVAITASGAPLVSDTFDAVDGLPVLLDPARPVTGTITVGNNGAGAGQARLDITVTATATDGEAITLTDTETYLVNPAGANAVNYSMAVPAEAAGKVFETLNLTVLVRGVFANHGYIAYDGKSFLTLPVFDNGLVEISTSPTFSAATTAPAAFDGTRWSASVPTPAAGARSIYARALQNGTKLTSVPVRITVTN